MLKNYLLELNNKYNVKKLPILTKISIILFFIACLYALYMERTHLLSINGVSDYSSCSSCTE